MKTWIEQYDANERALAFERRREAIERFGEHKEMPGECEAEAVVDPLLSPSIPELPAQLLLELRSPPS
jgi:hypothetical protein